jgi:hypothetical protein
MRPHGRLGLPALRNAACARIAEHTTTMRPASASSATAAPAAPAGEWRSPWTSASTVDAISRYPTMNGSSLASSAGMAENEPSLRHRVSAHTTPQDMSATVYQYPIGIRNCP